MQYHNRQIHNDEDPPKEASTPNFDPFAATQRLTWLLNINYNLWDVILGPLTPRKDNGPSLIVSRLQCHGVLALVSTNHGSANYGVYR
eukprot:625938-Pleurochrysis_carterae.AAC.4